MDSSTWIGYQDNLFRPVVSAFTVAEYGAQVCDQRPVPGYTHQVFGEMPTPNSGHMTHAIAPGCWNYSYGHQNLILKSCLQSGSINPIEQYLDGIPQPYDFHNLNRQSLFLADGTQRSYYVLPENYSFKGATSSTSPAMPTAEVCKSCPSFTLPKNDQISEKETHPGSETQSIGDMLAQIKSKLQTMSENLRQDLKLMKSWETKRPAAAQPNNFNQEVINMSDELPLYAAYATEGKGCSIGFCSELDTSLVNQQDGEREPENYALDRATPEPVFDVYTDDRDGCSTAIVDVLAGIPEQHTCEEQQDKQPTKSFTKPIFSPERPTVGTVGVFSLTDEQKPDNQLISLCVSKVSYNTFNEGAADFTSRHVIVIHASSSKLTNEKSTQVASRLCVHEAIVHCHDERSEINIKMQDVLTSKHDITSPCDLNNGKEVPFVLLYQLPRSSVPCIWDPGIDLFPYKQLHLFSWIPYSAILLLQLLHNKNNSSMCEFSLEKGRQVQWDPGIEFILIELWWFSKEPGYILRHLLAVKFGTHKYTYFSDTAAIMCASPANLIQQRRTIAALFQFWKYKLLSSAICTWDPGIAISSSIYHWLRSLTVANARPLSSLQTPEQAKWQSQVTTDYVWDPGTMLLLPKSTWLLLVTEEKERFALIPEQLSFWCNAMHYCKIFQRSAAISSLFHCHGIPLWLINFQVP